MIHLYTGEGKGKTTAAVGLAVRHAGAGGRVAFIQFLKSTDSGEVSLLESIPRITVLRNQVKHGFFVHLSDEQKQIITAEHNKNLQAARIMVSEQAITMLVLDELCSAYSLELIDRQDVDDLISHIGEVELIITGRDPDASFQQAADYITEMKRIRHPFDRGVSARKGVEF